ncbi:MAG: hypothetical protein JWM65_3051 [Sphingomonas bacterium]|nr:hypothetical protein [Sphingomonas bacterium]
MLRSARSLRVSANLLEGCNVGDIVCCAMPLHGAQPLRVSASPREQIHFFFRQAASASSHFWCHSSIRLGNNRRPVRATRPYWVSSVRILQPVVVGVISQA